MVSLPVLCSLFLVQLVKITSSVPTDLFFWEVESLITYTNQGEAKGLYNDFINELVKCEGYCLNASDPDDIVKYKHKYSTIGDFTEAFKDLANNNARAEFVNTTDFTFWFPVLKPIQDNPNVTTVELTRTESISLVTLRNKVDISKKFFTIYKRIDKFLIIAVSLAILFGIMFWLLDLHVEEGVKSFFQGLNDGLWWAINAMTTVGFGDVRPRRVSAKILGVIWMLLGLAISATMVSFAEEEFEKVDIRLNTDIVAVLNGTLEADIVKETPDVIAKEFRTYEEMFEALRNKDLHVAAINSDIAAYKQEYWNDVDGKKKLAVVKTIDKPLPVYLAVYGDIDAFKEQYQNKCTIDWKAILKSAKFKYEKQLQVTPIYLPSIIEMLTKDEVVVAMLYIAASMIGLGILFDIACFAKKACFEKKSGKVSPETLKKVIIKEKDGPNITVRKRVSKIERRYCLDPKDDTRYSEQSIKLIYKTEQCKT